MGNLIRSMVILLKINQEEHQISFHLSNTLLNLEATLQTCRDLQVDQINQEQALILIQVLVKEAISMQEVILIQLETAHKIKTSLLTVITVKDTQMVREEDLKHLLQARGLCIHLSNSLLAKISLLQIITGINKAHLKVIFLRRDSHLEVGQEFLLKIFRVLLQATCLQVAILLTISLGHQLVQTDRWVLQELPITTTLKTRTRM